MINLSPHLINLRGAKSTRRVIWLRQDPSASCAAEVSDMAVGPGKIHRSIQKYTKKTQKYTETHKSKQKYTEKHALLCHKQNASGACAVREASDMTVVLEKTHRSIQKYTETQRNT